MRMGSQQKTSLWTGSFVLLILLNLFNGIAGQMTIPLVAKYSLSLTPDLTLASTVSGLMSLVSLFICPFAGLLSDRIDRRKILIYSSAGYGIALIGHAFAINIALLVVLRLLTGLFFSVCSVTLVAYSTAFIPRERMGEGLGVTALASILAQAIGPAFGLQGVEWLGYPVTFIISGLFALFCMVVILFMPYSAASPPKEKRKISFHDLFAVEFTGFMLLAALFSSGNGFISTYLAIVAEERGIQNIALFFTVYSICMVALRPLTGKLLDRFGVYVILFPSVVFAALGMVLIGIGYSLGIMLVASVLKALGQGSGTPSLQAYVVKKLDKERAGVATSTIMIGQNVGNAVAPIIGSFFVTSYGYETMFCGFGGLLLGAGLLILLIYRFQEGKARKRKEAEAIK